MKRISLVLMVGVVCFVGGRLCDAQIRSEPSPQPLVLESFHDKAT